MSKAIVGAIEIAFVVAVMVVAPTPFTIAGLMAFASTSGGAFILGLGLTGLGMEVSAIGDALKGGPSTGVITRQAAQARRVVYGMQRIQPVIVFESTTGGKNRLNHILVWCAHSIDNLVALYLDGKQVHYAHDGFNGSDGTWGRGDGVTYTSEAGNQYSFGSGVYAEHRFGYDQQTVRDKSGNPAPLYMTSLEGNDSHWSAEHTLNGLAYTYLKLDYDGTAFPSGQPNTKATIAGKNDILDPRTGQRGYTNNAALIIADFLTNQDWGLRFTWDEIDIDELIASANVCDEQVPLASGEVEPRYTINGTFTVDTSPGDTLVSLLMACDGMVTMPGGLLKIIVGYDRGAKVAFDEADLVGEVEYSPKRSARGLFNAVSGTYICPRWPYSPVGNYYSQDTPEQGTFDGSWQPTTFPAYDLSAAHGFTEVPLFDSSGKPLLDSSGNQQYGDKYLAEDGGVRTYSDLKLQFVTSVSQAQRLAKIRLMKHRIQGTLKLKLKLCGLQVQPGDNVLFSYPPYGWKDKLFQVAEFRFVPKEGDENNGPSMTTELSLNEFDPVAAYSWTTAEERPINAVDYLTNYDPSQVTAPTSLTLLSDATTGVLTADGIFRPRIQASWTPASDGMVTGYQIQVQQASNGWFMDVDTVSAANSTGFISNVVQGISYTVRVRAVRQNGATSSWITNSVVVGSTQSNISSGALSASVSGQASVIIDSVLESGATTARIYGPQGDGNAWTYSIGSATTTVPSSHFTGLTAGQVVYWGFNTSTGNYVMSTSYSDSALQSDPVIFLGYVTLASATDPGTKGGYGARP